MRHREVRSAADHQDGQLPPYLCHQALPFPLGVGEERHMSYPLSGRTGCRVPSPASMAAEMVHHVPVEAHRPAPYRSPSPYLPAIQDSLVATAMVTAFQLQINTGPGEVVEGVEALVAPHRLHGKGELATTVDREGVQGVIDVGSDFVSRCLSQAFLGHRESD